MNPKDIKANNPIHIKLLYKSDHKNDEEDREFENNGNQPFEQIGQLFAAG